MKKSRELVLMLEAFEAKKIPVTDALVGAAADGLRAIRQEKYEERIRARLDYEAACRFYSKKEKENRRRQGNADSGAITSAKIAGCVLMAEKLGDPANKGVRK